MALSKRPAQWCVGFPLLEHYSGRMLQPLPASSSSSSCTFIDETRSSGIAAQEDRDGPFPCLGLHVCTAVCAAVLEEGTSAGPPVFSSVPFFATHEPHSCDQRSWGEVAADLLK